MTAGLVAIVGRYGRCLSKGGRIVSS